MNHKTETLFNNYWVWVKRFIPDKGDNRLEVEGLLYKIMDSIIDNCSNIAEDTGFTIDGGDNYMTRAISKAILNSKTPKPKKKKEFSGVYLASYLAKFALYVRNRLPSNTYEKSLSNKDQRLALRMAIWILIKELFIGKFKGVNND